MKISEIVELTGARVVSGESKLNREVDCAFSSDLLSDVLRLDRAKLLFITGMANLQTIRTAEIAEIPCILLVRKKKFTEEMKTLAKEHDVILLESDISMFHASGKIFVAGLKPVY